MSALTLPLDKRDSNNYIHALERQFAGKLRNARDMSVFFTMRPDTADSDGDIPEFFEEYKLLRLDYTELPSNSAPLDSTLEIGHFQIWSDGGAAFAVSGAGVRTIGAGNYLIPTGTEVTVAQNGSGTVPDADTFTLQNGSDFIAWVLLDGNDVLSLLPHTGKAWYGVLTAPAESTSASDVIIALLLKSDGTYHVKRLGDKINTNFEFFTHLYLVDNPDAEIYFTGKEFNYRPEGLPTGDYVAPTFTYVPD